tara:strand:+ start:346 stop:981 length:636 start_codon:yes stop_codon:yes gene_type:complete
MAISGIFLMIFLTQHLLINLTSLIPDGGDTFNLIAHFMGYNPIVQYFLQPVLIFGVVFHFIMGFVLEIKNIKSRKIKYTKYQNKSSWASRNMLLSGAVILSFLILHFWDFWVPEILTKFFDNAMFNDDLAQKQSGKHFEKLVKKFKDQEIRTLLYCVSFLLLGFHLSHGFGSSFQSMGTEKKYQLILKRLGYLFAILITSGFLTIAIYHYF